VPPFVRGFQRVRRIYLLARLHREHDAATVAQHAAARVGVERELGVDQVAMLVHEPADAAARRLFVAGQHDDQVASRLEPRPFEPDEICDQDRVPHLIVGRAPAVEVAVLLEKGERIDGPVRAAGRHDVQVRESDNGAATRSGAAIPRHEVAVLCIGTDQHANISRGKSRRDEPPRHGPCRAGRVAQGVRRVDLDQLAQNVARQCAIGGRRFALGDRPAGERPEQRSRDHHGEASHPTLAIASISTRTALGSAAACTVERAGL